MTWILVNVGCIECGVSSGIVGVFSQKNDADNTAELLNEHLSWREGGQNSYEVFEMPELDAVGSEYAQAIEAQRAATTKIGAVADESAVGTADAAKEA